MWAKAVEAEQTHLGSSSSSNATIATLQGLQGRRLHVLGAVAHRTVNAHEQLTYQLEWQASHNLPHAPPLLAMTGVKAKPVVLVSGSAAAAAAGSLSQAAVRASAAMLRLLQTHKIALPQKVFTLHSAGASAGTLTAAAPGSATGPVAAAAVLGVLKGLPYELPSLSAAPVDADAAAVGAPAGGGSLVVAPGRFSARSPGTGEEPYGLAVRGATWSRPVMTYATQTSAVHSLHEQAKLLTSRSTYAITGGTGGLGLLFAGWMAESGARHITLLGRSGRAANPQEMAHLLNGPAEVTMVRADGAIAQQAAAVLAGMQSGCSRLAGVIHAAGAQVEARLMKQRPGTMRQVIAPKTAAAQNFEMHTAAAPLAFSLLCSSVSAVAGYSAQANYAAANAALDAYANQRAAVGAVAVAVQWGAWSAVGMIRRKEGMMSEAHAVSLGMLSPSAGVAAMEALLHSLAAARSPRAAGGVGVATQTYWRLLLAQVKPLPRFFSQLDFAVAAEQKQQAMAIAAAKSATPAAGRSGAAAAKRQTIAEVEAAVMEVVKELVGDAVDPSEPLAGQGLDSLAAMELRQKLQDKLGLELASLIEDPQNASVQVIATEAHAKLAAGDGTDPAAAAAAEMSQRSLWISPAPVTVKLRLFCLPYAGGVSENVFSRWAMMLPASIQVCPIELPGRGRRRGEPGIADVAALADILADSLPLQDKPYALFGTCLGAIVAYEVAKRVAERKHAPMPLALFPAAVSAPHLYAIAVMKLYVQHNIGYDEPPPLEEVMAFLSTWDKVPKAQLLEVFERGHFAGLEEMKTNERLFNRVAPMGVNDIAMACQYKFHDAPKLGIPVTSFDGLADNTIDPGNVAQWGQYTSGPYRNVPIEGGDHYFVSTHYQEVVGVVRAQLVDIMDGLKGGGIMAGHSWLQEAAAADAADPQAEEQQIEEFDAQPAAVAAQQPPPQLAGFTAALLEAEVLAMVRDLVGADVAPTEPLAAQGLDSLAGMELRQKLQEITGLELTSLIEDPEHASVRQIVSEAMGMQEVTSGNGGGLHQMVTAQAVNSGRDIASPWISPAPISVKMRLFCLPYAGGVSENVFSRWAMMLPASIQVCPIELPGRGRRRDEPGIADIAILADALADSLPLQGMPYALFGTCLGAIVAYEVAKRVAERKHAPMPLALFPAAVSPPHLYAIAVMKLYVQHEVGYDEPPPLEEVMAFLSTWDKVPKEQLLEVFERGHFAGLEEMKTNERLFNRVAPMGVNDIAMACQYKFHEAPKLGIPVTSFDGLGDNTIDPGNVAQWGQYTTGPYRNIPIEGGDHYFVSTHYQQVVDVVGSQLLQLLDAAGKGNALLEGHSWLQEAGAADNASDDDDVGPSVALPALAARQATAAAAGGTSAAAPPAPIATQPAAAMGEVIEPVAAAVAAANDAQHTAASAAVPVSEGEGGQLPPAVAQQPARQVVPRVALPSPVALPPLLPPRRRSSSSGGGPARRRSSATGGSPALLPLAAALPATPEHHAAVGAEAAVDGAVAAEAAAHGGAAAGQGAAATGAATMPQSEEQLRAWQRQLHQRERTYMAVAALSVPVILLVAAFSIGRRAR